MIDHYANYAEFYDQGTTTDIVAKVDLIKQTIQRLNPSAKDLLEIACGTGNVLTQLQGNYNLSGLDLSANMLKIAKTKLPEIELFEDNMTSFNLARKFDVIICLFDSVNHLQTFYEWEELFDRAKEHLNINGVFIFDVNTINKLEKFSTLSPFRHDMENGYQIAKIDKRDDGLYHWLLDIYTSDVLSNPKVTKNDIPEAAFPLQQIEKALQYRFKTVEKFTPDNVIANELSDRIYFACKV